MKLGGIFCINGSINFPHASILFAILHSLKSIGIKNITYQMMQKRKKIRM